MAFWEEFCTTIILSAIFKWYGSLGCHGLFQRGETSGIFADDLDHLVGPASSKKVVWACICFIKEHFNPDRIWSVFDYCLGDIDLYFITDPMIPLQLRWLSPLSLYNALPWILLVCALQSFQALLITPHSNEKKSTHFLKGKLLYNFIFLLFSFSLRV